MDRGKFISAMRNVANSVSVVTTNGPSGRHGATVSSFCSVSADPPMVLVCLHADSKIARTVEQNGCFNVNVLPHDAIALADTFAGKWDCSIDDRFENLNLDMETVPALPGATVFECRIASSSRSGSHQIFIGDVVEAHSGTRQPLTYLDGAYQKVVPLHS